MSVASELINEWIDTNGYEDLRTVCGLNCRIEFMDMAIKEVAKAKKIKLKAVTADPDTKDVPGVYNVEAR